MLRQFSQISTSYDFGHEMGLPCPYSIHLLRLLEIQNDNSIESNVTSGIEKDDESLSKKSLIEILISRN